jgi:ABC-type molybdate transport system substrate-binding protein
MYLAFCAVAVSTVTLIVSSTLAPAAEVRVLSVGSTQIAAKAIATEFEKQTGHKVIFTIRAPFNIDEETHRARRRQVKKRGGDACG